MPSFGKFVEVYLKEYARPPSIKPHTARLYTNILRNKVVPSLGQLKLDSVSSPDVAKLHRKVGKDAPTAANNMLVAIASVYKYVGEIGLVEKGFNPVRNATKPFKVTKKERFLTSEEIARLTSVLDQVEREGTQLAPYS